MKIIPKDYVEPTKTGPLTVDDKVKADMVAKAKELLTEPMEANELCNALEQYYCFQENKHYTSKQISEAVTNVRADLAPVVEEVEPIVEEVIE